MLGANQVGLVRSAAEIILVTLEAIATIAGHSITFQLLRSLLLHTFTHCINISF